MRLRESPNEDGAMFALVGFLQQMLGTASDYVRYISGLKAAGQERFQSVVVETEVCGEDSVATGVTTSGYRSRVITQYKFSLSRRPIGDEEMGRIIGGLKNADPRPELLEQNRAELRLCTNRPLTSTAEDALRRSNVKYDPYNPSAARLALKEYASRFGTKDSEFKDGVTNLAGYLMELAASPGSHEIRRTDFDRRLTGLDNPQSIRAIDAANRLRASLEDQRSYLSSGRLSCRRSVEDAISRSAYEALIILLGEGGCGKTTALWQALNETAEEIAQRRKLVHLLWGENPMRVRRADREVARWLDRQ
jgi:hypothetical protein